MLTVTCREEGEIYVRDYMCGECGAGLQIAVGGNTGEEPKMVVRCSVNSEHNGVKFRATGRQIARRTSGTVEVVPIDAATARRQMAKLCQRYPDMLQDLPSAALFYEECQKLSLDPLMSPAEAVPVAFYSKKLQHKVIAMIITADGWLSMAARSAPDEYMGAPSVRLVADPATKQAISGSDHKDTIVVEANGNVRDPITLQPLAAGPVYGWFLNTESSQANTGNSGFNMADWRSTKRWVRKYFPACRNVMMQQTSEFMAESEGIKVTSSIIDAEFHLIEAPASKIEETLGAAAAGIQTGKSAGVDAHKVTETQRSTENSAEPPPTGEQLYEPKILKNLGQFYTACNERWGLTKSEVDTRFSKASFQIVDLWEAWKKIKEIVEPK